MQEENTFDPYYIDYLNAMTHLSSQLLKKQGEVYFTRVCTFLVEGKNIEFKLVLKEDRLKRFVCYLSLQVGKDYKVTFSVPKNQVFNSLTCCGTNAKELFKWKATEQDQGRITRRAKAEHDTLYYELVVNSISSNRNSQTLIM